MPINKNNISRERLLGGLIYAVVGTVIVLIIEHFRELPFNALRSLITFILFWIFGYIIFKKTNTKPLD